MKTKGGSLYEVLKSASKTSEAGPPTSPEGSTTPVGEGTTLQERLAAYKAAKLAAANEPTSAPVEPPPARVSSTTLVLEPDPTPIPAPAPRRETPVFAPPPAPTVVLAPQVEKSEETPASSVPPKGPGERVVRLTYNTVLFGGLITVGLLFISYAVGLHAGKVGAATEAAEVSRAPIAAPIVAVQPVRATPPIVPPPAPKKEYAIRLGEWKTASAQDRVKALALADDPDLKKALERAGHKGFEKAFINRGPNDVRMALYVDRFSDLNAEAAKAALTAMKTFKFKSTTPFDKAVFEEVQSK